MKSFFVIKGSPDRWFDQQGIEIPMYGTTDLPHVKSMAECPVEVDYELNNQEKPPTIKLCYHVKFCKDEEEVKYLAAIQNETEKVQLFYVPPGGKFYYPSPINEFYVEVNNPYDQLLKVTIEKV